MSNKNYFTKRKTNLTKVIILAFVFLIGAGVLGFGESARASFDLPWSTTFDCDEWVGPSTLNPLPAECNWLEGSYNYWCDGNGTETKFEQLTSDANYPLGGGGRGVRHWIGGGKNDNSNGFNFVFSEPVQEFWARFYIRYENGFEWASDHPCQKTFRVFSDTNQDYIVGWNYGRIILNVNGVDIYTTGISDHWTTYFTNGDGLGDSTWHLYEVYLKQDTNGSNGIAQVWIDEDLLLDEHGVDFKTSNFNRHSLGANQDWVVHEMCKYNDYDDYAISLTGRIGPLVTNDTASPNVSITSPTQGQTISGDTTISANASDDVGVVGVQFKFDGANLGAEDTFSPYSISWDTTAVSDGAYNLTATARDAAGNNTTSIPVTVTVNNSQNSYTILYETWEQNNVNNWDDDFVPGDTHINTSPVYAGDYAIKMESSNPGNYAHFFADHPGVDGDMVTDITLEEYYYLSPGFQWPTTGLKLWVTNCFESWSAGYDTADGGGKPHTWAPYYFTIVADNTGMPRGALTRADGLGGTGALWQVYGQNVGSTVTLTSGIWNKIKFRLKLNTLEQSDGIFQLWINDELKCNYSNMNFRGNYSQYGWNHLMMSMHGNPNHPQSQWASRDNILITSEVSTDQTSPTLSVSSPTGILNSGTTQTILSLTTNESATCKYSTTPNTAYGLIPNTFSTTGGTNHSQTITGLSDGNTYNYYIRCQDTATPPNQNTTDFNISFSIASQASDQTPPVGSVSIDNNETVINSPNTTLSLSASDPSGVTEMKISNTNNFTTAVTEAYTTVKEWVLTTGDGIKTVYVWFKDTLGNWTDQNNPVTDTILLDETAPIISNISISSITTTSVTVSFNTNENTTSYLEYGLTTLYGSQTNSSSNTSFSLVISNLSDNTTYNYRITSTDQANNIFQSTNQTFTTLEASTPDTTPPSNITNLTSANITQTSVDLNWTAPGDDNNTGTAATYDLRYSTSNITTEADFNNATQLSGEPNPQIAGTAQSFYIAVGLSPNTTYYFAIKTADEVPNVSGLSNILAITTLAESSGGGGGGNGGGGGGSSSDTTPPTRPGEFTALPADSQIVLSWTNPLDSDFVRVKILRKENSAPTSHDDSKAEVIYEGTNEEYTDIELDNNTTYYYSIFAYDKKPNYSNILNISSQPIAGKTNIEKPKAPQSICFGFEPKNLFGLSGEIAECISLREAKIAHRHNQFVPLSKISLPIYEKIITPNQANLAEQGKRSIAFFIHNHTITTKILGAGERAGVISSYKSAFNKLPETESDWQDIIKIANGRWPNQRSEQAENRAKQEFKIVYLRDSNMDNPNDNAAITVMAYGLRSANRNLNSEKAGIRIFKAIYGYLPESVINWDVVRAIAYSGAER